MCRQHYLRVLILIYMRECVIQAFAKFSSVLLGCQTLWDVITALTVFIVKIIFRISSLKPAPIPPAERGAQDVLIESDSPAGSDTNREL